MGRSRRSVASGSSSDDPIRRARQHIALGRYAEAIAEADAVLVRMLKPRLTAERFVARALCGDPPEELLLFSRAEIARMPELRDALIVRWEALRRAGREEAAQLRELCTRYWPERISVWEAAGNHALDDAESDRALAFFDRALALDPTSVIALAGKAIACEMKKDWAAALELRREVAEQEQAWAGDDAISLHRVLRYAANLGRLGRWGEASPLFRGAVQRGTFDKLAQERAVLLRVFTGELYAPAIVKALVGESAVRTEPAVALALQDAVLLAALAAALREAGADPRALGMCALQAGDLDAAYRCFDDADSAASDDMVTSHLLLSCALELGTAELPSIRSFALELARTELDRADAPELSRFYALLTLRRCGEPSDERALSASAFGPLLRAAAAGDVSDAGLSRALADPRAAQRTLSELERWTALREAFAAFGHPPGLAARACARARLAQLRSS